MKNRFFWILISALAPVWMGCVSHKPVAIDSGEVIGETFGASGTTKAPDRWWEAFGDEELASLVEQGLAANLDMARAWARLDQAGALYRQTAAGKKPTVDLASSISRNEDLSNDGPSIKTQSLSLNVSYQLDLWGRISARTKAGDLDYQASREDVEATALTLGAQLTRTWFDLAENYKIRALIEQQVAVNEAYLSLVELRFSQGSASATEVLQQRQQLASRRNSMPQIESAIARLEHQLAVLLGEAPDREVVAVQPQLPELPAQPVTGIPADVLARRPDVKAAEYRLLAADQRLLAARLERYPRIDLAAAISGNGEDLSAVFDSWFLNLTSNIISPLFDGGTRKAEVARNQAVVEEQFAAWKSTVLEAVREVEDALVQEQALIATVSGLEEQVRLAEQTLESARKNYVNGITDYLNVLTSLQNLQNLQVSEIQERNNLLANRVGLYLALGGSWTDHLQHPKLAATHEPHQSAAN